MATKSAIIHEGVREVHATSANEDYASLCGLDGNDPHDAVQQSMGKVKPGEKINCPQCQAIIRHARTYRLSELA